MDEFELLGGLALAAFGIIVTVALVAVYLWKGAVL